MKINREGLRNVFRTHFTPYRIAYMAVFAALAYVVSFLEIPIFPAAPMLKLDLGNVFVLLPAFMLGPVEGVLVCVVKELLRIPFSSSGGVGEVANMIMTASFILIPSIVYRFKKGLPVVIGTLAVAVLFSSAVSLLVNRYVNFPLYGDTNGEFFRSIWHFILFFNLIKGIAVAAVTIFLYKPVHKLFLSAKLR